MPPRSTPFQKLVHHIQTQLSGSHSVQESAMLRHRLTGQEREVDIVIRGAVGEHDVTVCVECIEKERPADVTWVEQMKAKHDQLDTDRLVLVSLAGFTETALVLAESFGIATYTPEDGTRVDWTTIVGKDEVLLARYDFAAITTWIRIREPEGPRLVEAHGSTRLRRSDNGSEMALAEMVTSFLNDRSFVTRAMNALTSDIDTTIEADFNVGHQVFATDEAGREHEVLGFRTKARATRRSSPIALHALGWKGMPAAFGQSDTVLGDTVVTFVEPAPGRLDTRVHVDGKPLAVFAPPLGSGKAPGEAG